MYDNAFMELGRIEKDTVVDMIRKRRWLQILRYDEQQTRIQVAYKQDFCWI
jgi:hypothetical protein